jgi:Mg2+/citrate symporter
MSKISGKTKNEILEEMDTTAAPGSRVHEQQKMAIIVRSIEDLEKALSSLEESMNNNAKSNTALSKKVFWLNVILTIATVTGTIAFLYTIFREIAL